VPDWDDTESRESDEDAAWRDLVARFDEPITGTEPVPWPERENVPGARPRGSQGTEETGGAVGVRGIEQVIPPGAPGAREARDGEAAGPAGRQEPERPPGPDGADGAGDIRGNSGAARSRSAGGDSESGGAAGSAGTGDGSGAGHDAGPRRAAGIDGRRGFDDEGVRQTFADEEIAGANGDPAIPAVDAERARGPADAGGRLEANEPDMIQTARRDRGTPAHGTRPRRIRARKASPRHASADDEEHYIPPAPPPLPTLDPITKGAWAALFGGPGYLVIATAVGWSVPGIAAFLAVAAFVAGFAVLVLRMNDPGPGSPDDGDDGAVV